MSEIKEGWHDFGEACLDTPFDAPCLKKRGKGLQQLFSDKHGHGKLVSPAIDRSKVNSAESVNELVTELNPATVIVRGHGWPMEVPFVWRGTVAEFNETWTVD